MGLEAQLQVVAKSHEPPSTVGASTSAPHRPRKYVGRAPSKGVTGFL